MDDDHVNYSIFDEVHLSFDDYLKQFTSGQAEVLSETDGSKCEISEFDYLYNAVGQQICVLSGTRQESGQFKKADAEAETGSAIHRMTSWDKLGHKTSVLTTIRSPYMKAALKAVIPEHMNCNFKFNHISFDDKPQYLFHFRDLLFAYGRNLQHGSPGQRHVSMLIEYLQQELEEAIAAYTLNVENSATPSIDFANLWTIFRSEDLIYLNSSVAQNGVELVVRYQSLKLSCSCNESFHRFSHFWTLAGSYLRTSGKSLGRFETTVSIPYFDGFRALEQLTAVPLHFHSQQETIRDRLVQRGRRFVELQGCHFKHYKGTSRLLLDKSHLGLFRSSSTLEKHLFTVEGRIMVDSESYSDENDHETTSGGLVKVSSNFSDDTYLTCSGHVGGYSFNERSWGLFDVDRIGAVDFDGDVFSTSLMLDNKFKNIMVSLIRMQSGGSEPALEDIIKGKGQGLIFLLHGGTGVGKTLTAESIADHCQRPLLKLDVKSLCNSSASLEKGLERALRYAERWKAIALLDEADMFLEPRTTYYLQRNSFTTAFLRILDYFGGTIFLTTNRINSIDPAFKSRIQVAIPYPKLNRVSRKCLWQIFLSKVSGQPWPNNHWDEMSEELASDELNGREIRDAVRIANASAFGEKVPIGMRHLQDALELHKTFDEEFEKGRAEVEQGWRDDPQRSRKRLRSSFTAPELWDSAMEDE